MVAHAGFCHLRIRIAFGGWSLGDADTPQPPQSHEETKQNVFSFAGGVLLGTEHERNVQTKCLKEDRKPNTEFSPENLIIFIMAAG
jgi:hypothetical protein